jgi:hypothetical protein
MKERKRIPRSRPPEVEERHRQTQELIARRIAYHRAKIEEERAQRVREAS